MDVRMPDGVVIKNVPDGTTQADLGARYQAHLGATQAQPEPPADPTLGDYAKTNPVLGAPAHTVLRSGQGIEQLIAHSAADLSDLGGHAPNSLANLLHAVADHVDTTLTQSEKGYQESKKRVVNASTNPRVTNAAINTGEVEGNLLNPAGLAGNAIKAESGLASAATRGAVSGGAVAATQPVDNPENFYTEKGKQVATGATIGGATGTAAEALGGVKPTAPPTTAELHTAATAKYKAIENTPVPVTPEMSDALSGAPGKAALTRAIEGAEANRETGLLNELKSLLPDSESKPTSISANAADKISQAFRGAAQAEYRSPTGNANIARGMTSRRADFETGLRAVPEVKDARAQWAQYEKSQIIDDTIQAAKDNPVTPAGVGGPDQAMRREFGKLIRSPDFDSFSPAEQTAIKQVAGGNLTANILQRLGKFSPVRSHLTAILEMGAATGGHVLGGVEGAVPAVGIAVGGEVARRAAEFATLRNALNASRVVRGGPNALAAPRPAPNAFVGNPTANLAINALLQPRAQ